MDASSMACLGVCGYLIGLALPLFPALDVPLVFLVLLASGAVVVSQHVPGLGHLLAALPLLGFAVARVLSAVAAPDALRSLQVVAPLLPALLLFFAVSELVHARRHVLAIYASLTAAGLVLSGTFLATAWLSTTPSAERLGPRRAERAPRREERPDRGGRARPARPRGRVAVPPLDRPPARRRVHRRPRHR